MIRQSISLLLLLAFVVGCKKESDETALEILPSDLLGYHIVIEGKNKSLQVFFFVENSGSIDVFRDSRSSRRVRSLSTLTKEGDYTFDVDNNGRLLYTFRFQKDRQGNVFLASSHYKIDDSEENQIEHIQLVKSSSIGEVIGKTYVARESPYLDFVRFTSGVSIETRYNTAPTTDSHEIEQLPTAPYTIGWKSKVDGSDYFGVFVDEWKSDKGPFMLFQMSRQYEDIIWLFKPAN